MATQPWPRWSCIKIPDSEVRAGGGFSPTPANHRRLTNISPAQVWWWPVFCQNLCSIPTSCSSNLVGIQLLSLLVRPVLKVLTVCRFFPLKNQPPRVSPVISPSAQSTKTQSSVTWHFPEYHLIFHFLYPLLFNDPVKLMKNSWEENVIFFFSFSAFGDDACWKNPTFTAGAAATEFIHE